MDRLREPSKRRRGDRPSEAFRLAIRPAVGHIDIERLVRGRRGAVSGFGPDCHQEEARGIFGGPRRTRFSKGGKPSSKGCGKAPSPRSWRRHRVRTMSRMSPLPRAWKCALSARTVARPCRSASADGTWRAWLRRRRALQLHRASIARLDPSSSFPQVVVTHFTGGAHCCTVMKVLTFIDDRWEAVNVGQFDADGPRSRI